MSSDIVGSIKLKTMLSGMPELRLGLNDRVLFALTGRTYTVDDVIFLSAITIWLNTERMWTDLPWASDNGLTSIWVFYINVKGQNFQKVQQFDLCSPHNFTCLNTFPFLWKVAGCGTDLSLSPAFKWISFIFLPCVQVTRGRQWWWKMLNSTSVSAFHVLRVIVPSPSSLQMGSLNLCLTASILMLVYLSIGLLLICYRTYKICSMLF